MTHVRSTNVMVQQPVNKLYVLLIFCEDLHAILGLESVGHKVLCKSIEYAVRFLQTHDHQ